MGSMFGGFWMILLPWDATNTICLSSIGYFSQNMGVVVPSKLIFTTNHLLENVALNGTKLFNVWWFWMVLLPWDARNTICLALIGYFSQNIGLFLVVPGRFFFEISFKDFWKYLKTYWFSGKIYKNMFCRKFTQLSGKLKIVKISGNTPALYFKKPVSFFLHQSL